MWVDAQQCHAIVVVKADDGVEVRRLSRGLIVHHTLNNQVAEFPRKLAAPIRGNVNFYLVDGAAGHGVDGELEVVDDVVAIVRTEDIRVTAAWGVRAPNL